jgi:phosphatidylglycerophosphatase A
MTTQNFPRTAPGLQKFAVALATGLGLGLLTPAPGTVGSLIWGMPLAWAIGQIPGLTGQILAIVLINLVGIPVTTIAGRALGGEKDNQSIVWDEIATVPLVFLFVPLTNWRVAIVGYALHRLLDITKPPPARQLERLPEGLGVMADDWMAGAYACVLMTGLAWLDRWTEWGVLYASGG